MKTFLVAWTLLLAVAIGMSMIVLAFRADFRPLAADNGGEQLGNCLDGIRNERSWLVLVPPQFFAKEPAMFLVDWLKGAIPVEKEICDLITKDEAIAPAKTRAPDVAKRHSGREPDGFRLSDATGKILAVVPIRDSKQ